MKDSYLHPRVSTLGVSVTAVREQLLLLGHTIPDDVIINFLNDGLAGLGGASDPQLHSASEAHARAVRDAKIDMQDGQYRAASSSPGHSKSLQEPDEGVMPGFAMETGAMLIQNERAGAMPYDRATSADTAQAASNAGQASTQKSLQSSEGTTAAHAEHQAVSVASAPATAAEWLHKAEDYLVLPTPASDSYAYAAASASFEDLSRQLATLQINVAPAAHGLHVIHGIGAIPDLQSNFCKTGMSSIAPMSTPTSAEVAPQSKRHISAEVPVHMPGACSLPNQGFSWRQLISQPLYPERMPAEGQVHDHDSKAPDQAHAADTRQDHAAAAEGFSCPHCSASIDSTHCNQCALTAVQNRAWSGDLYKGIPAVQNYGSAVLKTSMPGRMLGAPERGTGIGRTHGRGKDTVQRPLQHAAQHAAASTRSSKHSRLSAARQSSPRLSLQGKENANQQRQKPLPPGDHSGRLQNSSSQRQVKVPAGAAKNACESPRYGSPRCAQTSSPSTPRLSTKGPKRFDRVARFRQMQAIWAGDAFLRSGAAGANGAGKRKKLGFCKAFADVHAANERMHNLFIECSDAHS